MRILLATPTRDRPGLFKKMVKSARLTANQSDQLSIVARVDHDDPRRRDYITHSAAYTLLQGKRVRLPVAWNEIAERSRYDILMMCADDLRFRTIGWDDDVREVFEQWPDRIGLVYADDGLHDGKLATHPFVSREWIKTVGYYLPSILHGDFVDNWLHFLAAEIGRVVYLPRVYIEHMHPFAGKAPMDDTYNYRLSGSGPTKAQAAWNEVMASGAIQEALAKLKGAIGG